MSEVKLNVEASLKKLAACLKEMFPDYNAADPAESDRRLLQEAKVTEAQLAEIYSGAFGVPVVDEEGKYKGFLSKSRVLNTYRQTLVDFSED